MARADDSQDDEDEDVEGDLDEMDFFSNEEYLVKK